MKKGLKQIFEETIIPVILFGILAFGIGCDKKESHETAKPASSKRTYTSKPYESPTSRRSYKSELEKIREESLAQLAKATHAEVLTEIENWDRDAENDGIVVYLSLKDDYDETIKFENIKLRVSIKIYSDAEYDSWIIKSGTKVYNKPIYEGYGSIDSWKDGNPFLFGGGIRVPFEDIKFKTIGRSEYEVIDNYNRVRVITYDFTKGEYGTVYVTIKTPYGNFEAKDNFVRIKPE